MKTNTINPSYLTLEEGQDYTYKALCSILKENTKSGNSKISQLKRWNKYFKCEKKSKAVFHIVEIYKDAVNDKYKLCSGSKMRCEQEFNNVFYYMIFNQEGYYDNIEFEKRINIRPKGIFTPVGIERSYIYKDIDLISAMQLRSPEIYCKEPYQKFNMNQPMIDLFKSLVTKKSKYILNSRIDKLEKYGIISHEKCIATFDKFNKNKLSKIDCHVLPKKYLKYWNQCEEEMLQKLGFNNIWEILNKTNIYTKWQNLIKQNMYKKYDELNQVYFDKIDMVIFEKDYEFLANKYSLIHNLIIDNNGFDKVKASVEHDISVLKKFMNIYCKEAIEKRIEKYNLEYDSKIKIKNSEEYKKSKHEIEKLIEIGFQYTEIEEYFNKIESYIHKFTDSDKKILFSLCDNLVGGIEEININNDDITEDIFKEDERKNMKWLEDI